MGEEGASLGADPACRAVAGTEPGQWPSLPSGLVPGARCGAGAGQFVY